MYTQKNFESLLEKEKDQVFLFVSSAGVPLSFASHPWFVINKKGTLARWEILLFKNLCETSWGHLHLNYLPPSQGLAIIPPLAFYWGSTLVGHVAGDSAKQIADFIERSPETYPYTYTYSLLGPNSNTYGQWVLDAFPQMDMVLPWNAFGKGYTSKNNSVHAD